MTHMLRKQHRDSRMISKVQPKIRIIHIFAPEIIQTDVANFRELVQRLTGKPSSSSPAAVAAAATTTTSTSSGSSLEKNINSDVNKGNKLPVRPQLFMEAINGNNNAISTKMAGEHDQSYSYNYKPVMNVNSKDCFGSYDHHRDNGGFLEEFEGVNDCFMQEMGDFSLVPMEANGDHHHHHHHLDHHQFEDNLYPLSYRG